MAWETWDTGAPILSGALASFECATDQIVEAGDHLVFIGRVTRDSPGKAHAQFTNLLVHPVTDHSTGHAAKARAEADRIQAEADAARARRAAELRDVTPRDADRL